MRAFLLLLCLALVAAACAGGQASTPSASTTAAPATRTPKPSTPTPSPTPSPAPTPEPTPAPPPSIDLSSSHPRQGGFLLVRLLHAPPGLPDATALFAERSYTMLPAGDRWYTVIGIATWHAVGGYPVEVTSSAGPIASASVDIGEGGFQFENLQLPPSSSALLSDTARIEAERVRVEQVLAGFSLEKRWSGAWVVPTEGHTTNTFGLQRSINGGPYYPHTGTDLANAKGTPVYAAAAGVVALAEGLFLYGESVILDHGAGVFSSYNHMDSLAVTAGQTVNQGDLLGYMGETGMVTGPHLHWEAIVHGVRVDPTLWTQTPVEP